MKIVTHDGPFHADEVTAVALLHIFQPFYSPEGEPRLVRTRNVSAAFNGDADVVVDVGGVYCPDCWQLDHHQFKKDERLEYEGIPLSSAGMTLLNLYDKGCIRVELKDALYNRIVCGIDAIDNGINLDGAFKCATLSSVISTYNYHDPFHKEQDKCFMDAVRFMIKLINKINQQELLQDQEALNIQTAVKNCEHQTWLELPNYYSGWQKVLNRIGKLTHFSRVIWPQKDGEGNQEWRVQVPPKELGSFDLGHPPLNGDYVSKQDLIFVHSAKFIGATKTLQSAKLL